MLKENRRERTYSFSQPKLYLFVVNHGGKICLVVLLFMALIALIKNREIGDLVRSIHVIIFLSLLIYLAGRFLRKFAYKIDVDFESQSLRFFMNRSKDIVTADFDEVRSIRVNGYIIFVLTTRKVFYSGALSKEILTCLSKIKKIQWGFLCVLLGPSKDLRDALEQT